MTAIDRFTNFAKGVGRVADSTRKVYNRGLVKTGKAISMLSTTQAKPINIGTKIGDGIQALGSDVYFRPATAMAEMGIDMSPGSILLQTANGTKTANIGLIADHHNPNSKYAANFGLVAARGGNLNVSGFNTEGPDDSTNAVLLGKLKAGDRTKNFAGFGKLQQGDDSRAIAGVAKIDGSENNLALSLAGSTTLDDSSAAMTGIGSTKVGERNSRALTGLGSSKAGSRSIATSLCGTASVGNKGVSMTGLGKAESREEGASASLVGFASSGDKGVSLVGSGISLSGSDGDAVTVAGVSFTDKNGRAHSALGPEYQGGVTGSRPLKQRLPSERDKPVNEFCKRVDDLRSV